MTVKNNTGSYDGTGAAIFHGITDLFRKKELYGRADDSIDMSGKTCLVTGANSGLGYATALRLARMGAEVIMACRSQIPQAGEKLKAASGSEKISMEYVDLTDFRTINKLGERLKNQERKLDVLVCNAGVVCQTSRPTSDGYDTMIQVNFLAKFHLINTFLDNGLLKTGSRVIFVSSEAHRTGLELDIDSVGSPISYTAKTAISLYGYSKLLLTVFSRELARRYGSKLSVFTLCPGPVASNISREAPKVFHPLLKLIFLIFFRSPRKASDPTIFFASDSSLTGKTDLYLHLMVKKAPDPRTADSEIGTKLWEKSEELIQSALKEETSA